MMAKSELMALLLLLACCSCNTIPDTLSGLELANWYNKPENGYLVEHEINEVVYQVKWIPLEVKIWEKGKSKMLSIDEYNTYAEQLGGLEYYEVQIRHEEDIDILRHGVTSDSEYLKRIDYLAFKAKDDFVLQNENAETACRLYHFERSYGLGKHITINLAFPKTNAGSNLLIYTDNVFGAGLLKFRFENNQGPKLKLKA